eukprot:GABV01008834.1.p1 GENE.GABV01008834.1~~GABV01008834.1.p1  ORF type:complete len:274 (+),score=75.31 GABV01008834.1:69-890(+)
MVLPERETPSVWVQFPASFLFIVLVIITVLSVVQLRRQWDFSIRVFCWSCAIIAALLSSVAIVDGSIFPFLSMHEAAILDGFSMLFFVLAVQDAAYHFIDISYTAASFDTPSRWTRWLKLFRYLFNGLSICFVVGMVGITISRTVRSDPIPMTDVGLYRIFFGLFFTPVVTLFPAYALWQLKTTIEENAHEKTIQQYVPRIQRICAALIAAFLIIGGQQTASAIDAFHQGSTPSSRSPSTILVALAVRVAALSVLTYVLWTRKRPELPESAAV